MRHRRALQDISFITRVQDDFEKKGRKGDHLAERLEFAINEEDEARSAVLKFPIASIEDLTTKAEHIHELMLESDESFDKDQLDMLLRSLMQPEKVASNA